MSESYLDYTDVAVSSYIARTSKAIDFYKLHIKDRFLGNDPRYNKNDPTSGEKQWKKDEMYHRGLFLCIGEGPSEGWDSDVPPLPELETYDIQNPICFKYYTDMFFVKSDVNGKINVGDLNWSKVSVDNKLYNNYLESLVNGDDVDSTKDGFEQIRNELCRWIYVSFQIDSSYSIDDYIRQVGIYSKLKIKDKVSINPSQIYNIGQIEDVETGLRKLDGYLELIQNKMAFKKDTSVLNFSFVLEF